MKPERDVRSSGFPRALPFIWLNDGAGHFSTLKVGDLVAAGREEVFGTRAQFVATRNGYSFIATKFFPESGNQLMVTGVLATKPYLVTTRAAASRK
jgi:hypothetical protein